MDRIATKEWWGPRIWRILHILAEFSDRSNVISQWRSLLQSTANVLPCPVCRTHFHDHSRRFHIPSPPYSPVDFRNSIRRFLWQVHQGVRGDNSVAEADLEGLYGGDRTTRLQEAQELVKEIQISFTQVHVLDRFQSGALTVWVRALTHVIAILSGPPPLPVQPLQTRGRNIGGGRPVANRTATVLLTTRKWRR